LPSAPDGYDYWIDFGGSAQEFPMDDPTQVPALTEWGVLILVLLLLIAGAMVIRRQRAMSGA
jgi:hypothetical protein